MTSDGSEESDDPAVEKEIAPRPAMTTWRDRFTGLLNISKRTLKSTADLERQIIFSLNPKKWPTLKQLRHCGRVLNIKEKNVLTGCAIVIFVSVIWLTATGLAASLTTTPVSGGSYTEAIIGQPTFINPIYAASSAVDSDLTRLIFSGLFKYSSELKIEPDLASGYEISSDGRVYTVYLKENLRWHDNDPLTADDVVFTFASIANPEANSPLRPSFNNIVIEKIDDRSIRFTLKEPYNGFVDLLTTGLIPKHIWGDIPYAQWRERGENLQPIGNGSWQYNTLVKNGNGYIKFYIISLDKSERPWSDAPAPFLDRIIFKFYPDEIQALDALGTQDVDGLAMLSSFDSSKLKGNKRLTFHELKLKANTAIFFNLNISSPVQDLLVRRALKLAIDRQKLTQEILPDEAVVTSGWLGGIRVSEEKKQTETPISADELLTKAGWEKIGAIRKNKNGDTLDLTLTIIDREPDRRVGEFIQEEWGKIGVETKISLVSPPSPDNAQRSVLRPRAYEALLYTIAYGATYDPYPFWHSSQRLDPGLNISLFSNHDADQLIEQGRRAVSKETKDQAYGALQKIILDEIPAVFLYLPVRLYAIQNNVKGFAATEIATPADRFNGINKWYVKEKIRFKW